MRGTGAEAPQARIRGTTVLNLAVMCARYNIKTDLAGVAGRLTASMTGTVAAPLRVPTYNVAPMQVIPAVTLNGTRRVRAFRWGLLPGWANAARMASHMINARSETVSQKPAFRRAFQSRRCLIPATGFYEWTGSVSPKQPWLIQRADGDLLVMAGLWETNCEFGETCTVVTCQPSGWMSQYHHRMPVVLDPDAWGLWLSCKTITADLRRLLVPAGEEVLTAYPVSRDVNTPRNNHSELLHEVPLEVMRQGQLEPRCDER